MANNIDVRVSAGLHPDNVQSVDGYCDETAPVLGPTKDAFHACYNAIAAVADAREASKTNPAWTPEAQVIMTADLAEKYIAKVATKFDIARNRLLEGIASIERELSAPIASKGVSSISAEVRAHTKALSPSERTKLVRRVIEAGDDVSATAILGGPAFLSGLSDDMKEAFTRQYHEKNSPGSTLRLRAMKGAVGLIEKNAPLMHTAFSKAVGAPPATINALRAAKSAAEKHMIMKDLG